MSLEKEMTELTDLLEELSKPENKERRNEAVQNMRDVVNMPQGKRAMPSMAGREQLRQEHENMIDELIVETLDKKVESLEQANKNKIRWIYFLVPVATFWFALCAFMIITI